MAILSFIDYLDLRIIHVYFLLTYIFILFYIFQYLIFFLVLFLKIRHFKFLSAWFIMQWMSSDFILISIYSVKCYSDIRGIITYYLIRWLRLYQRMRIKGIIFMYAFRYSLRLLILDMYLARRNSSLFLLMSACILLSFR